MKPTGKRKSRKAEAPERRSPHATLPPPSSAGASGSCESPPISSPAGTIKAMRSPTSGARLMTRRSGVLVDGLDVSATSARPPTMAVPRQAISTANTVASGTEAPVPQEMDATSCMLVTVNQGLATPLPPTSIAAELTATTSASPPQPFGSHRSYLSGPGGASRGSVAVMSFFLYMMLDLLSDLHSTSKSPSLPDGTAHRNTDPSALAAAGDAGT
mmetsp:Transcript_26713/g.92798  ORF Transcript_26713/g.92798 Transcript_26713/m.92798 type:complete len:215 (-) Transcript_26713:108-752(-)